MEVGNRGEGQDLAAGFAISVMRFQNSIKSQHNSSLVLQTRLLKVLAAPRTLRS